MPEQCLRLRLASVSAGAGSTVLEPEQARNVAIAEPIPGRKARSKTFFSLWSAWVFLRRFCIPRKDWEGLRRRWYFRKTKSEEIPPSGRDL